MNVPEWPPARRLGILSFLAAYAPPLAVFMFVACVVIVALAAWAAISPLWAGVTGVVAAVAWVTGAVRDSVWAATKNAVAKVLAFVARRLPLARIAIPAAVAIVAAVAWFGFPALSRSEWLVLAALFAIFILCLASQVAWFLRRQSIWHEVNGL